MSSEVFRFVNLRPTRPTDSDDNTVVFYHGKSTTTFHRELQALKASGRPRQAFEERAAAYLNSENYALGGAPLPVRFDLFAEWLSKQGPVVPVSLIQDQLNQQLGNSLPNLLSAERFSETRNRIADSTVASAILPSLRRDSRGVLIRLMRVLGLLERFQRWPAEALKVRKAMSALLLLPRNVFPLPPAENPLDKRMKEEAEKNLKRYQDAAKRIEDLAHKLGQLQYAATEIATAYAADTNDARRAYSITELVPTASAPVAGGDVVIPGGQRSVMSPVLTMQRATALSVPTKDVLNEMTIRTEFVDVHHTVTGVEQEVAAISEKLFNGRSFTTLVRIGNVFVPVDKYTVEGMTGSDKVPGACMQGAPESPVVTEPTVPDTQPSSIRPIGIADLLQVRQKIKRYVPGEIAHIENIMAGESKERTHRQSTRIVETRILETETTREESRDLQTAERFELQQEVSEVIREESSREVGISISVSYGPFAEGTANLNFARSESQEESNKNATRYSREVTDKAVRRTQERVLERRTVTTEREFEETNKHALNNADGDEHIVGIYRWVDKLYEAQVISYGLRMMFEFVIPEPAALYRHG